MIENYTKLLQMKHKKHNYSEYYRLPEKSQEIYRIP